MQGLSGQLQPDGGEQTERPEHDASFDFIIKSMRQCIMHLGPWSVGDLAFGLYAFILNL